MTLADGPVRFWSDESRYSNYGIRIDPDDYIHVPTEAPPGMEMPPVQLQQSASPESSGALESRGTSHPGGTSELGETPGPGGLDDVDSGPPTPLPLVRRGIPPSAWSNAFGGECGPWWKR